MWHVLDGKKVFQGEWPHLPSAAGKYSHKSPGHWPLDLSIWRSLRITVFYTKQTIWDGGQGYCTSAFEWGQLCKINSVGQYNSAGDSPKIWVILCHSLLMTVPVYFRQSWFIPVMFNNDTDFHFQMFSSCDNKISGHIICNTIIKGCSLWCAKPDVLSKKQEQSIWHCFYLVTFGCSGADMEEAEAWI